jgi:hypothetical protein
MAARAMKVVGLLVLFLLAHDPSGWMYPQDCCGGSDCRPVPCVEFTPWRDGLKYREKQFTQYQIRHAPDGSCHVCIHDGNPVCAFVPEVTT